jgi:hypothetical protein
MSAGVPGKVDGSRVTRQSRELIGMRESPVAIDEGVVSCQRVQQGMGN